MRVYADDPLNQPSVESAVHVMVPDESESGRSPAIAAGGGSFIMRSLPFARRSVPASLAWLGLAGRAPPSEPHFLARAGDAHGVLLVLRSLAPTRESAKPSFRINPPAVHPRTTRIVLSGLLPGISIVWSLPASHGHALCGFWVFPQVSRTSPTHRLGRCCLGLLVLFQVFGRATPAPLRRRSRRASRARLPDRPSTLALSPRGPKKAIRSWAWDRARANPPFSVLQDRCLVHPEQPSNGKELSCPAAKTATERRSPDDSLREVLHP